MSALGKTFKNVSSVRFVGFVSSPYIQVDHQSDDGLEEFTHKFKDLSKGKSITLYVDEEGRSCAAVA